MDLMTMTMLQQQQQHHHNHQQPHQAYYADIVSPSLSSNCGMQSGLSSSHGSTTNINDDIRNIQSVIGQDDQASMRKLVNKLGGTYASGKPLSLATRRQIVAMAEIGMKACDISRRLQISHGCVSKIIAKWRSTGSFEPRRIGGSRPKKTIGHVVAAVRMYKRSCPSIRSLEIRHRLLADGVCNEYNVPSLSSINRIIRMKLRDDLAEFEAAAVRDLMAILASATTNANSLIDGDEDDNNDEDEDDDAKLTSSNNYSLEPSSDETKSEDDDSNQEVKEAVTFQRQDPMIEPPKVDFQSLPQSLRSTHQVLCPTLPPQLAMGDGQQVNAIFDQLGVVSVPNETVPKEIRDDDNVSGRSFVSNTAGWLSGNENGFGYFDAYVGTNDEALPFNFENDEDLISLPW